MELSRGRVRCLWADKDRLGPRSRKQSTPASIGSGLGCARAATGETAPLDLRGRLEYAKRCHSRILPWNEKDPHRDKCVRYYGVICSEKILLLVPVTLSIAQYCHVPVMVPTTDAKEWL